MPNPVTPQQVLSLAQSLTRCQHAFTDYELEHYEALSPARRAQLESGLATISGCAGRLYAYSVVLTFANAAPQLDRLQKATAGIDGTVRTLRSWQKVFGLFSSVTALAAAVTSHDAEGIVEALDELFAQIKA